MYYFEFYFVYSLLSMFPAAITASFPRYYEKELEGKAYKNIIVEKSSSIFGGIDYGGVNYSSDNKIELVVKSSDHFSVVNPSEKLIKETDGVLRLVELNGTKFLLSEFTYEYYFSVRENKYSSVIIMFVQRDIFDGFTITTKLCGDKMELFEITCGSDIGGSVRSFLGDNMRLFGLDENSIIDIKHIAYMSRCFERKLIGHPTQIYTAICLVTHTVDIIEHKKFKRTSYNTVQFSKIWIMKNVLKNKFRIGFGPVTQKLITDLFNIESKSTLDSVKSLKFLTHYGMPQRDNC